MVGPGRGSGLRPRSFLAKTLELTQHDDFPNISANFPEDRRERGLWTKNSAICQIISRFITEQVNRDVHTR